MGGCLGRWAVDPDEAAECEEVVVTCDGLGLGEGLTAGLAFAFAASSRRTSGGTGALRSPRCVPQS